MRWIAAVLCVVASVVVLRPAGAEPVPVRWTVDARLGIAGLGGAELDLTGGRFDGTVDLDTGAITGDLTVPPGNVTIGATQATVVVAPTAAFAGSYDPQAMTLAMTATFDLQVPSAGATCKTSEPTTLTLTGPIHARGATTVTGELAIPAFSGCGDLGSVLDQQVAGPGNPVTASLKRRVEEAPAPGPPTSPPTTPAPGPPTSPPTDPPPTPAPGETPTAAAALGYTNPVVSEQFDTFDENRWFVYGGPSEHRYGRFYPEGGGLRTREQISVAGGAMTVTGLPNGHTAGMSTEQSHRQQSGLWEARIKLPSAANNYHSVFIIMAGDTELDWVEVMEPTGREVSGFMHLPSGSDNGRVTLQDNEWHNWAIEWTADKLTLYLDGQKWHETQPGATIPSGEGVMTIQLDWFPEDFGHDNTGTAALSVDWVNIYAAR